MSLSEELAGYRAGDATEAAHVQRLRELLTTEDLWTRSSALHITGSAVVVHPPTGRVLLRWHERQQDWLQVGGHADPGEVDPLAVAMREGVEETGLDDLRPWPDAGIVHVAVVPVEPSPKEPAHEHADIRYALATDVPDLARPENPKARLRWLPVAEAVALTRKPNTRETLMRVGRLLDAHAPCS
ncbi:NUDIX hydrolase [Rugosimonospora acidiphila]|uniref:NUDIX hydrolase n=1 Tax=Rugosimonospora acidiphila TaxID=556531 RepID=UPI0031E963DE